MYDIKAPNKPIVTKIFNNCVVVTNNAKTRINKIVKIEDTIVETYADPYFFIFIFKI